jgi:hypothetical protein
LHARHVWNGLRVSFPYVIASDRGPANLTLNLTAVNPATTLFTPFPWPILPMPHNKNIPRMSCTRPVLAPQKSSGSDNSDSSDGNDGDISEGSNLDMLWRVNGALCLIQHDVDECPCCRAFGQHYVTAMLHDEPSLQAACEARNISISRDAQSSVDGLRVKRDDALERVAVLRQQIAEKRRLLQEARVARREAESTYLTVSLVCNGPNGRQDERAPEPSSPRRKHMRSDQTTSPRHAKVSAATSVAAVPGPPAPMEELTGDSVGLWIVQV